jgi:rhamnose transport system substrate-binding protein
MKKTILLGAAISLALATSAFAADPVKIVMIGKNTGNPYFDGIIQGFKDSCAKIGCSFEFVAPATAEATSQIPFVEAQIQKKVDVIAISPNSPDALNGVFDEARKAGILVISLNGDVTGSESHRDAAILPTDFDKVGENQVELMGSLINYEGDVAILSATTEAPDQNKWINGGMKSSFTDNPKYAKMKLVGIVYGDDQPEKSTTEMEALLSKYPNLKGVISPTTVGVAAAAQVVETAGVADKVAVTGLGTPNQMRPFIKDGTVKAFQLWSPYNEGVLGAYFSVGVKGGTIKNEVGTKFDVPDLGTITINANNSMNTQAGLTTFDAKNIDSFNF